LALQDFLVQLRSIGVFERKESTNQGEQNDPTTPGVNLSPNVLLASDHLRGSITRTTAGRLQSFAFAECVGEAEVNDLNVLLVVEE